MVATEHTDGFELTQSRPLELTGPGTATLAQDAAVQRMAVRATADRCDGTIGVVVADGPNGQADGGTRMKPAKPYAGFPLFAHATGRWAKKIGGRFEFFGPWADPHGALERYAAWCERHGHGSRATPFAPLGSPSHTPPGSRANADPQVESAVALPGSAFPSTRSSRSALSTAVSTPTLRDVVNRFLTAKQRLVESGELTLQSFGDYHRILGRMLQILGPDRTVGTLTPDDFARFRSTLAKTRGPFALSADITKVRTLFRFAEKEGLIGGLPRYGPGFEKPSKKTIRQARTKVGERMFEPEEIAALLEQASVPMRAMVLLGLNGGMGNTDVAALPRSAVKLDQGGNTGQIEFPRPKTGIARRVVLWPETVEALRLVEASRPTPARPEHGSLVFLTRSGKPWTRVQAPKGREKSPRPSVAINSVTLEFSKLMDSAGVRKPGRGFYGLRHTFRTVADEIGDRRAIDLIMGHEHGGDVSNHYVERVSDERLRRVVGHVRGWVLGSSGSKFSPSSVAHSTPSDI